MHTEQMLTEREILPLLGGEDSPLSIWTVRLWRRNGQGPDFVRLGGRLIRYKLTAVQAYLAERTVKSSAA